MEAQKLFGQVQIKRVEVDGVSGEWYSYRPQNNELVACQTGDVVSLKIGDGKTNVNNCSDVSVFADSVPDITSINPIQNSSVVQNFSRVFVSANNSVAPGDVIQVVGAKVGDIYNYQWTTSEYKEEDNLRITVYILHTNTYMCVAQNDKLQPIEGASVDYYQRWLKLCEFQEELVSENVEEQSAGEQE